MALQDLDLFVTVPSIDKWLRTLNDYANSAIVSASFVANNLTDTFVDQYNPDIQFESTATNVSINHPTKPDIPTLPLVDRVLPAAPTIDSISVDIGTAPVFNIDSPSVNLPSVPSPLDISLPVKNFTVDIDFDFPVTPDTTLPNVPTLLELNIPAAQSLAIPTFDIDFPTSNSLVVPGITFGFSETSYSDTLLTTVKDSLISRLTTSTGLSPIIENAIWDRGRDRESRAILLAENNLLADQVAKGFSRPIAAQRAALESLYQESQSKIIDLSRDIMIKQAELEQENIKTSIQQTIALEDLLIKEHSTISQRSFEVAKYIQDISIELFKVEVSKFTAEVTAYQAFASAYQARVQAELSKIEIFKAQIEAEKLKGDVNEQNIRLYLARIEGVKSNVEIFKSLIAAVSEKIRAESLKLESYRTDVDAYSSAVKAKADEFGIYSEQIKGELAKVEVFDSQVKAFTSRIQAYSSASDIILKKAEVDTNISELNIKKYESQLDAFIKQVQADQLTYQSAIDLYKGELTSYQADLALNTAIANLEIKNSENIITQNKYKADLGISNAQITLESIKGAYNAMISARQSAGSIYQAIGSSALSAINVSAAVSGQVALQGSESHNYNVSQ